MFMNLKNDSCWINSMLQMVLSAIDHSDHTCFNSALGLQLMMIQPETLVDPSPFKMLLQNEREKNPIYDSSQSIVCNQQDAREFLATLSLSKENAAWADICKMLQHTLVETFSCAQCPHKSQKTLEAQLFHTVESPPNNMGLKGEIEKCFKTNEAYPEKRWEDHGDSCIGATRSLAILTEESSLFLIIMITRNENSAENQNDATDDLMLNDSNGKPVTYELIAAIEHIGEVNSKGADNGHYICDVKYHRNGKFYRTNDSQQPVLLKKTEVTKRGYFLLYKRK